MRGRPRILPDFNCLGCQISFRPSSTKTKFCSMRCAKKNIKKKGVNLICAYCGDEFYAIQARSKQLCCKQEHTIAYLKNKAFNFNCAVCNKVVFTQPAQIQLRSRKTCSIECRNSARRVLAEKRRVEEGYTKHQLDRLARYSPEAKRWREDVFKRDDWTCVMCKKRGGRLEADHIKPWAYFPKLRFDLNNGRTLCRPCHDTTKVSYKTMRKLYGLEAAKDLQIRAAQHPGYKRHELLEIIEKYSNSESYDLRQKGVPKSLP